MYANLTTQLLSKACIQKKSQMDRNSKILELFNKELLLILASIIVDNIFKFQMRSSKNTMNIAVCILTTHSICKNPSTYFTKKENKKQINPLRQVAIKFKWDHQEHTPIKILTALCTHSKVMQERTLKRYAIVELSNFSFKLV